MFRARHRKRQTLNIPLYNKLNMVQCIHRRGLSSWVQEAISEGGGWGQGTQGTHHQSVLPVRDYRLRLFLDCWIGVLAESLQRSSRIRLFQAGVSHREDLLKSNGISRGGGGGDGKSKSPSSTFLRRLLEIEPTTTTSVRVSRRRLGRPGWFAAEAPCIREDGIQLLLNYIIPANPKYMCI